MSSVKGLVCLICTARTAADDDGFHVCSACDDWLYDAGRTFPPIESEDVRERVRAAMGRALGTVHAIARAEDDEKRIVLLDARDLSVLPAVSHPATPRLIGELLRQLADGLEAFRWRRVVSR